jgi:hypothetical protein
VCWELINAHALNQASAAYLTTMHLVESKLFSGNRFFRRQKDKFKIQSQVEHQPGPALCFTWLWILNLSFCRGEQRPLLIFLG